MTRLLHHEHTCGIIGACFEVHKELGCGFLENVYQEALALELTTWTIPLLAQPELRVHYKHQLLQQTYRPDFVCREKIVVKLKATRALSDEHRAQVLN